MRERWAPIQGYEGLYEISDHGRVCGFARGQRIIKTSPCPSGYVKVCLHKKGKRSYRYIHDLVLSTFVGPRPSPKHEGNHGDGIKSNNEFSNLEWMTKSANMQHAFDRGLVSSSCGDNHWKRREMLKRRAAELDGGLS